jgi:hypothetical protein
MTSGKEPLTFLGCCCREPESCRQPGAAGQPVKAAAGHSGGSGQHSADDDDAHDDAAHKRRGNKLAELRSFSTRFDPVALTTVWRPLPYPTPVGGIGWQQDSKARPRLWGSV